MPMTRLRVCVCGHSPAEHFASRPTPDGGYGACKVCDLCSEYRPSRAAKSRAKGVKGEREVALIWQGAGLAVRGLEGAGDHVVIGGNGVTLHSEVKRAERLKLPEWLRQAAAEAPQGMLPVVAFRQNRGEWFAVLPLEALAQLVAEAGHDDR